MHRVLPENLYERRGYYSWRNPDTGKEYGLGRDRDRAIAEAKQANRFIQDKKSGELVQRLAGDVRTIAAFRPRFDEILEARKLAPLTRYNRKWQLKLIEKEIGHIVVGPRQEDATEITRQVAAWLRGFEKAGKRRTAQALRSRLLEMFSDMAAEGWIAVNPIEVIRVEAPAVKRARLTFDDYVKIYKAAAQLDPWVRRSMELALVTLQRREDITRMSFRDQADGRLKVEQAKSVDSTTGEKQMRLRIPLSIRLDVISLSLGDIVHLCRDNVVSRWLVHHDRNRGQAEAGDPVHPQTITGAFREARTIAGIMTPDGKTPPTFHELRSLGIRLFKQQGYDPQVLAGHKDPDTTAVYTDNRGAEWIDVAA